MLLVCHDIVIFIVTRCIAIKGLIHSHNFDELSINEFLADFNLNSLLRIAKLKPEYIVVIMSLVFVVPLYNGFSTMRCQSQLMLCCVCHVGILSLFS